MIPPSEVSATLQEFLDGLGVSFSDFAGGEQPEQVSLARSGHPTGQLRQLDQALLIKSRAKLGKALGLTLELAGDVLYELTDDPSKGWPEAQRELAAQPKLDLEIRVDKNVLCKAWFNDGNGRFFISPNELANRVRHAATAPHELESLFWGGGRAETPVFVLLGGSSIDYEGPFLTFAGANTWNGQRPDPPSGDDRAFANEMRAEAIRNRGPQSWVSSLTPVHLRLEARSEPTHELLMALRTLEANLALFFLSSRVELESRPKVAVMATNRARLELGFFDSPIDNLETANEIPHLNELSRWAYQAPHRQDRFKVVQSVFVARLGDATQPVPAMDLVSRLSSLKESAEWGLKSFIDERITSYSEEERQLQGQVAEMVNALDEQVSGVVKGLSATMLATVGALLGSILASVFGRTFNPEIFRIGMYTYAAYVFVFPGLISLMHENARFNATLEVFEDRKKRFGDALGTARMTRAIGNRVENAEKRFRLSFWVTVVVYALVGLSCILSADWFPNVIAKGSDNG